MVANPSLLTNIGTVSIPSTTPMGNTWFVNTDANGNGTACRRRRPST